MKTPTRLRKRDFHEISPNVFTFDLFSRKECEVLRAASMLEGSPNSMNKYGAMLRGARVRKALAQIVATFVQPITSICYPEIKTLNKNPYAFLVYYEIGKQRQLDKHFDAGSAVTLNVCLGGDFKGGDLVLYSKYVRKAHRVEQVIGRAIVHRGTHVHRAMPITEGSRTNLILWCGEKKR